MFTLKTLVLISVCLASAAALTACETATGNSKGYTLKTVKWSRAPRGKFDRIVKVPKSGDKALSPTAYDEGARIGSPVWVF